MNFNQFGPVLPNEPGASVEGTGGGGSSASTPASEPSAPPAVTPAVPEYGTEENFEDFLANVEAREKGGELPASTQSVEQAEPPATAEPSKPAEPSLEERLAEAERARAAAEAKAAALENPASREKNPPTTEQQDDDPEPDPANYEFGLADAKYIADTARWNARQEFRIQEQQRATRAELVAIETSWNQRVTDQATAEKYPDFNEKVVKGADRNDWALSPVGALLVKSSEFGPDIAYYLASNPEESRRIAAMEPYEQMRVIARLEGRYEAMASAPKTPVTPPKAAPSAPPPPVNRTRGAGGKFTADLAEADFAEFSKYADSVLSRP